MPALLVRGRRTRGSASHEEGRRSPRPRAALPALAHCRRPFAARPSGPVQVEKIGATGAEVRPTSVGPKEDRPCLTERSPRPHCALRATPGPGGGAPGCERSERAPGVRPGPVPARSAGLDPIEAESATDAITVGYWLCGGLKCEVSRPCKRDASLGHGAGLTICSDRLWAMETAPGQTASATDLPATPAWHRERPSSHMRSRSGSRIQDLWNELASLGGGVAQSRRLRARKADGFPSRSVSTASA
jgi:hypothetical protein